MYLQQARDLLKIDNFFRNNPKKYNDYFMSNMDVENKLGRETLKVYMSHKKQYGLARQEFLANEDERSAQNFIEAAGSYSAFKYSVGFSYISVSDFYQKEIIARQFATPVATVVHSLGAPLNRRRI